MPTMHTNPNPSRNSNVLSWAIDLDDRTLEQAERSASLPIVRGHVALMPDAHFGYGATRGSVIPTEGAVVPSAVIARDVPAGVGQGHSAEHRSDEPRRSRSRRVRNGGRTS